MDEAELCFPNREGWQHRPHQRNQQRPLSARGMSDQLEDDKLALLNVSSMGLLDMSRLVPPQQIGRRGGVL